MKKTAFIISLVGIALGIVSVALLAFSPSFLREYSYFLPASGSGLFAPFNESVLGQFPKRFGDFFNGTVLSAAPTMWITYAVVIAVVALFITLLVLQIVKKRSHVITSICLVITGSIASFFAVIAFCPAYFGAGKHVFELINDSQDILGPNLLMKIVALLPYLVALIALLLVVVSSLIAIVDCSSSGHRLRSEKLAVESATYNSANECLKDDLHNQLPGAAAPVAPVAVQPQALMNGGSPLIVQYINCNGVSGDNKKENGLSVDDIRRIIAEEVGSKKNSGTCTCEKNDDEEETLSTPNTQMLTEDDLRKIISDELSNQLTKKDEKVAETVAPETKAIVKEEVPETTTEMMTESDLRKIVRDEVNAANDERDAKAKAVIEEDKVEEPVVEDIKEPEPAVTEEVPEEESTTEMLTENDLRQIIREEMFIVSEAARKESEAKEAEKEAILAKKLAEEAEIKAKEEEVRKAEEAARKEEEAAKKAEEDARREEEARAEAEAAAETEMMTEDDLKKLISDQLALHDSNRTPDAPGECVCTPAALDENVVEKPDEDSYLTSEDLRQIIREEIKSTTPTSNKTDSTDLRRIIAEELAKIRAEEREAAKKEAEAKLDAANSEVAKKEDEKDTVLSEIQKTIVTPEEIRSIVSDELAKKIVTPVEAKAVAEKNTESEPQTIIINLGESPVRKAEPIIEPEPPVETKPVETPVVVAAPEPVKKPIVVGEVNPALPPHEKIIRIPFPTRMNQAEKDLKDNYNELKAEALSYGLKSRVSNSGDTFRLHTKTYLKITIAGKGLKIYFALNPADYANSPIPVNNAGIKNIYKDIPTVFKVRSELSVKRAKQLIADACEKDKLEQGKLEVKNYANDLKNYKPQNVKDDED